MEKLFIENTMELYFREILFAINPEAIVAMLFMEKMHECDAIGIFNVIQY